MFTSVMSLHVHTDMPCVRLEDTFNTSDNSYFSGCLPLADVVGVTSAQSPST